MKRIIFLASLFFCSVFCYSQTWSEKIWTIMGVGDVTLEYTVITSEQFNRLVQQYKATNSFCRMEYTDVLEIKNYPVVTGTRPTLTGYYFLLAKKRGRLLKEGSDTILIYGNSNTGRMELEFYNDFGSSGVRTNSDEYVRRWNQFLGWIKVN